eukprot:2543247-Rhodomonas_salina.1
MLSQYLPRMLSQYRAFPTPTAACLGHPPLSLRTAHSLLHTLSQYLGTALSAHSRVPPLSQYRTVSPGQPPLSLFRSLRTPSAISVPHTPLLRSPPCPALPYHTTNNICSTAKPYGSGRCSTGFRDMQYCGREWVRDTRCCGSVWVRDTGE